MKIREISHWTFLRDQIQDFWKTESERKSWISRVRCQGDMHGRPGKLQPSTHHNSSQTYLFLHPTVSIVLYYLLEHEFTVRFSWRCPQVNRLVSSPTPWSHSHPCTLSSHAMNFFRTHFSSTKLRKVLVNISYNNFMHCLSMERWVPKSSYAESPSTPYLPWLSLYGQHTQVKASIILPPLQFTLQGQLYEPSKALTDLKTLWRCPAQKHPWSPQIGQVSWWKSQP